MNAPVISDPPASDSMQQLQQKVGEVAQVLKSLGNESRLLILCKLVEQPEMHVGALVDAVGISQSALSQHLAKLREEGLVTFRRDAQTLHYRCADPRAAQLLGFLHEVYCRPPAPETAAGGDRAD